MPFDEPQPEDTPYGMAGIIPDDGCGGGDQYDCYDVEKMRCTRIDSGIGTPALSSITTANKTHRP